MAFFKKSGKDLIWNCHGKESWERKGIFELVRSASSFLKISNSIGEVFHLDDWLYITGKGITNDGIGLPDWAAYYAKNGKQKPVVYLAEGKVAIDLEAGQQIMELYGNDDAYLIAILSQISKNMKEVLPHLKEGMHTTNQYHKEGIKTLVTIVNNAKRYDKGELISEDKDLFWLYHPEPVILKTKSKRGWDGLANELVKDLGCFVYQSDDMAGGEPNQYILFGKKAKIPEGVIVNRQYGVIFSKTPGRTIEILITRFEGGSPIDDKKATQLKEKYLTLG